MKHLLIPITLCVTLLCSCISYDDATTEITARVQLAAPAEFVGDGDLGGRTIVLNQGGQTLTAQTNQQGVAEFTGLVPDVYDISCSWELTADDYHRLTGDQQVVSGCTVSGSLNSHLIKEEQTIQLSTNLSINRDIVISKVYFAGSTYEGTNRAYTAGQYLELYNQSDKAVDVSGLYIGLTESESTQAYTLQNLHEAYDDSVLVMKQIFQIPADQPYVVEPGGTVLITNSAVDHSEVSAFEHNLQDADFEAKDQRGLIQNNPATPGLTLVYSTYALISYINFLNNGLMGTVIFRTSEDVSAWKPVYAYGKTRGNMFVLLPKRYVIDAVESVRNLASTGPDVGAKRIYTELDAGYTYVNAANGRNGEVVYRKTTKRTDDGRLILSDTNNSSNDFQTSTTIKPREYDADVARPNE